MVYLLVCQWLRVELQADASLDIIVREVRKING